MAPSACKSAIPDGTRDELDIDAAGVVSITQRVGVVDLGTLEWVKGNTTNDGTATVFYTAKINDAVPNYGNIRCAMYTSILPIDPWEKISLGQITLTASRVIVGGDRSYTSAAAFRAAVSGVMLYYELATPQTAELGTIDMPYTFDDATVKVLASIQPVIDANWWTKAGYETGKAYNDGSADLAALTERVTTAESSITQQAGQIALKANAADVNTKAETAALLEVKANKATLTSEINASADTVKIDADRVNIEGAAIFTSGRLSETSVADQIKTAVDTVEVGGRNLVRSVDRYKGYATDAEYTYTRGGAVCSTNVIFEDRTLIAERSGDIAIPYTPEGVDGAEVTLSFEHKLGEGGVSRAVSCYPYQNTGLSILNSGSFTPTDSWQRFAITTKVHRWTTGNGNTRPGSAYTPESEGGSGYRTNGEIWIWDQTGTNSIILRKVKIERGNKATDWTPALEDTDSAIAAVKSTANNAAPKANAVKRTQRIYFRSKNPITSWSMPTAWVTASGNVWNDSMSASGWSTKVTPMSKDKTSNTDANKYLYLYTCEQYQMADDSAPRYTTVLLDDSTTVIDGGNIITGSVTANQLSANSVTADKIAANAITVGKMPSADQASILNSNVTISNVNGLQDALNGKETAGAAAAVESDLTEEINSVSEDADGTANLLQALTDGLSQSNTFSIDEETGEVTYTLDLAMQALKDESADTVSAAKQELTDRMDARDEEVDAAIEEAKQANLYLHFDEESDGLEIGKNLGGTAGAFRQLMDDQGTHWQYNREDAAYVGVSDEGKGTMFLDEAQVTGRLRIGDYVFMASDDGTRMSLKWIGE